MIEVVSVSPQGPSRASRQRAKAGPSPHRFRHRVGMYTAPVARSRTTMSWTAKVRGYPIVRDNPSGMSTRDQGSSREELSSLLSRSASNRLREAL